MSKTATLSLDDQLCFAVYAASIEIGRTYKPILDRLGLTYTQYLVLSTLGEGAPQRLGAIADRLALEPSTISPLVKRMVAAGFLSRERNPGNDREILIGLTPEGKRVRQKCACLATELAAATGMPVERLLGLARDVREVRDALAAHREARTAA